MLIHPASGIILNRMPEIIIISYQNWDFTSYRIIKKGTI
jgi:hypothetical protein